MSETRDPDVVVVGGGPAGALAAWRMASAGARVLVIDRSRFPRHKLCGDTLNPGAVSLLRRLQLDEGFVERGVPLAGMLVTGPRARIEARYAPDVTGRAILRRVLDEWLLGQAARAGATIDLGVTGRAAVSVTTSGRAVVTGVVVSSRTGSRRHQLRAKVTVAADGRASAVARSVGLSRFSRSPRRWAFGTYALNVDGVRDIGEMHVRAGRYIGIAPVGGGVSNVCVVTGPHPPGRTPLEIVTGQIRREEGLRDRFASARFEAPVTVLGPLAVDTGAVGVEGLLLAGDAAGFIDPMTGDGLHLALRGGLLAADEALLALDRGDFKSAPARLAGARRAQFGSKIRFNRAIRQLVESPLAVDLTSIAARWAPAGVRWAIRYAGDAA